jgi:hypothetical protein
MSRNRTGDAHDRQSYLRDRSGGRLRNYWFRSVRDCSAVRRKLERGRPDHPRPLRKHPIWPRNKRRPDVLYWWILWRLPGTGGRPGLAFRACPGECSGWPAQRLWDRSARAISGRRDLGRSRAVRCLLRCLERLSLLMPVSAIASARRLPTLLRALVSSNCRAVQQLRRHGREGERRVCLA